jgi:peptide chain release factor 1
MEASPTELGGFSQVNLAFDGEGSFRELQYESGGHRVQRVPQTETKGRVHTSAATVVVMPEPEDVEVNIKPDDYRLDKYCASGPGGQHVNKTESAVRLTHHDTGIVVAIQDEKSQHKNLAKALRILKSRVYEHYRSIEHETRSETRRTLAGSGDRSERIRTYNFPDNRVTDHRIGLSLYKLDQIIAGNLGPVTAALIEHDRNELRDSMGGLD